MCGVHIGSDALANEKRNEKGTNERIEWQRYRAGACLHEDKHPLEVPGWLGMMPILESEIMRCPGSLSTDHLIE